MVKLGKALFYLAGLAIVILVALAISFAFSSG